MRFRDRIAVLICACFILFSEILSGQQMYGRKQHIWKPQQDEVYLQEVAEKISTKKPLQSVAELNGTCYVVLDGKLQVLHNGNLSPEPSAPSGIQKIQNENNSLWALTSDGIYLRKESSWQKIDDKEYVDICTHNEAVHAATKNEIYRFDGKKFKSTKPEHGYYSSSMTMVMEDGTQLHADPVELGPITEIESYSGTLYVLRPGQIVLFDGLIVNEDFIDWGSLPSKNTGEMLSLGSRLFINTDRGLAVLRGATLTTLKGEDGLPVENTSCLTKGFDGDIWIGTQQGAVRMLENEWHYFGAGLWLPDNNVNDIAAGDSVVYIATDGGLGIIKYEPFTLQKKADYYELHLEEWGHKRLGFIHTLYQKEGEWVREISDNDGGHTSPYLAAMSYKYAVTGDEEDRKQAVDAFKAMIWLEQISPVEGFFARAIYSPGGDKDEMSKHGSGGLPAKWYKTSDGKWIWKGDTSSDEVIAHFYSVSIFYELAAKGKEKDIAKEHLKRIASYIIDCGWVLNDMDGKPTRWGRWNPEYLLRPYGYVDRGINGLEALAFTKTAWALTGDEKFKKGYQQLVDWGYPENTLRQKNVFPPENIATWDDNHAFRSYYTLLRYAEDPRLRNMYLRSLERTWEVKRMEQIPWFNFVYGAITGNDCDEAKMIKHLREWVLDCTEYSYQNSHRDDLFIEPGYISYEGGRKRISPREMSVTRASRSPIDLDGGSNGRRVMEPVGFLRDYWMGRYHGFIEAPTATDSEFISVKRNREIQKGAKPYKGEQRPEIF
ncbi:hypothetical protein GM418_27610 [Maribellus comscasis]|uniref:Uncharacterized protein n=1 Tax=Maribellus comscasis TaxID=2681766 RepID=A0A6I6JVZ2_9BACT|nr:hypothetical protein [Maribellus comscasis]QGY47296.1 hypothetical protein GM418_27610 [Maribellus comscasis]